MRRTLFALQRLIRRLVRFMVPEHDSGRRDRLSAEADRLAVASVTSAPPSAPPVR